MKAILSLFLLAAWVLGVVLANGFWSTLFAFIMPFWSWYLCVERFAMMAGVIR